MNKTKTQVHLGFITMNAGDNIPGSTIKWTIDKYHKYFDSTIVVDGCLTKQAEEFYNKYEVNYLSNPWDGQHRTQYIERERLIKYGDWILALDCDEAPSDNLISSLRTTIEMAETNNINIIYLPVEAWWSKNNSKLYYCIENYSPNTNKFCKRILYKKTNTTNYYCSRTGTHVTPSQGRDERAAILKAPYNHFKSPETMILNMAICLMEDLDPIEGDRLRGCTEEEHRELKRIGAQYDILSGPKFRKFTKDHAWPKELIDLVKSFKDRDGHCRMLYNLYFGIEKAVPGEEVEYEKLCEIGDHNDTYKHSIENGKFLYIPHTDTRFKDSNMPAGAG